MHATATSVWPRQVDYLAVVAVERDETVSTPPFSHVNLLDNASHPLGRRILTTTMTIVVVAKKKKK